MKKLLVIFAVMVFLAGSAYADSLFGGRPGFSGPDTGGGGSSYVPATVANTFFVSVGGAGDKTGANWDNAFDAIQDGIDAAAAGDAVSVAGGLYTENLIDNKNVVIDMSRAFLIGTYTNSATGAPGAIGALSLLMIYNPGAGAALSVTAANTLFVDIGNIITGVGFDVTHTEGEITGNIDKIVASSKILDTTSIGRVEINGNELRCSGSGTAIDLGDGGYFFYSGQRVESSGTLIGYSGASYGQITIVGHEINCTTALSNINTIVVAVIDGLTIDNFTQSGAGAASVFGGNTNGNFQVTTRIGVAMGASETDAAIHLGSVGTFATGIMFGGAESNQGFYAKATSEGVTGYAEDTDVFSIYRNFFQLHAPLKQPISTKTASYTFTNTDTIILASGASAAVTITTLDATNYEGVTITVKAINTDNAVVVDGHGAQTIDGALTKALGLNDAIDMVSDGSNWFIK